MTAEAAARPAHWPASSVKRDQRWLDQTLSIEEMDGRNRCMATRHVAAEHARPALLCQPAMPMPCSCLLPAALSLGASMQALDSSLGLAQLKQKTENSGMEALLVGSGIRREGACIGREERAALA